MEVGVTVSGTSSEEKKTDEDEDVSSVMPAGEVSMIDQSVIAEASLNVPVLRYPNQRVLVVKMVDYVYAVPFVDEEGDIRFLKTIIPSRKLTRDYLEADGGGDQP